MRVFSRKKFSSYLGEQRALLDIITSYEPNPTPTPTPTPSMTPTLTNTPTPSSTLTPTPTLTNTPTLTSTPTLTPTPSAAPWSPLQLTGIFDWWSADYGVDGTGDVNSWEGHLGTIMGLQSLTNKPKYSATNSSWNNKPAIIFNENNSTNSAEGMFSQVSGLNTDKTLIIAAKLIGYTSSTGDTRPIIALGTTSGQPSMGLFVKTTSNEFLGYNNQPDSETYFGSVTSTSYIFSMIRYERGAGFYEYYSSTDSGITNQNFGIDTGQTADVNYVFDSLFVGGYITPGDWNKTPVMSVTEVIAMDSYITPEEVDLLKTYLNNKYGL